MTTDHDEGWVALADGGKIAYRIDGLAHGGDPILLIRPLGGSMVQWGSFRALLANDFRVISFDHRGSGRSSASPTWVTTQSLARDALAVLDHLSIQRARVFGISIGGMAATWLAILAPTRVAKLCLAVTPARGIELTYNGIGRELRLAASLAVPRDQIAPRMIHRLLSRGFRESHPEEVRRIERAFGAEPASRVALIKLALAGAAHDARRELHRIVAPTLVLAGENDHLLGVDPPRALAAEVAGATFDVIAASGHDLTLEQPIATAERVARFFRG